MKKRIIGTLCAAALLSSCHIYKSYDRPEELADEIAGIMEAAKNQAGKSNEDLF